MANKKTKSAEEIKKSNESKSTKQPKGDDVIYQTTFNGYSINAGKRGCHRGILEVYNAHVQDMLSRHCKVLQKRFDLRYPQDGSVQPDKKHIYRFTENLRRDLLRNNPLPSPGNKRASSSSTSAHDVDPRMIWVREQHDSDHPHCHVLTLVNGNAKNSGYYIQKKAEKQWANVLGRDSASGMVHNCNQSGPDVIMVDKNKPDFEEKCNAAYYQGSYLAKTRGKEKRSKGSWKVGGSRLPKDKK